MKNKLTSLSILALAVLICTGAFILVFNPFNGSAFATTSPTNHNANNNATSPSGQVISPSSGTQPNHLHNDDGSSNGGWDANDG